MWKTLLASFIVTVAGAGAGLVIARKASDEFIFLPFGSFPMANGDIVVHPLNPVNVMLPPQGAGTQLPANTPIANNAGANDLVPQVVPDDPNTYLASDDGTWGLA